MKSDDLKKRKANIISNIDNTLDSLTQVYNETNHACDIIGNTSEILNDLDKQFCSRTGLTKTDMKFLFTAIGLQIARQYLLTQFPERLDDQTAAKEVQGNIKEHSNRKHRYYNPTLNEITNNPVPFDANVNANGALKGGGKMGHRVTAIGHDPLLGLIFGTANIATATLTTSSFDSYHIYTNENKRDYFKNRARTDLVLSHTLDKMLNQGKDGREIVATALLKEIKHLRSDINSKNSLPLPIVSVIDPKIASELANYGLDMSNVFNVGTQASYTWLINSLIAMIHRLFCDADTEMDKKMYEVRTRKILSYSNLVASSSNLAAIAITKNTKYLDLGGLGITIYRLITDAKFIRQVKEEFIFGSYKSMIRGDYKY